MDPTTALGLACNVVQLVDVFWKVVSKSREIYKNGALPENRDLETITLDLQQVNSRLLVFLHQADEKSELSEEDQNVRTLCLSCNKIGGELVARLDLLKVSNRDRNWKSVRQALKSVWIISTLDEIAARLQACRLQLNTRILLSLRECLDILHADGSRRFNALDQSTREISNNLVGSRIHLNTSQEIQTQYFTRFIASQHDQTRKLIAGTVEASRARGTSTELVSALPRKTSPARSQIAVSIFDATEEESIPILRAILRQDPSAIFAFDDSGKTALHIAAAKGNPELVAYLIRNGAKLNPDDNGGKTPLHCAVLSGNEELVRTLVSKGADVHAKDVYGRTPKDYTNPSSLLEWTLAFGAHLEARNGKKYTALSHYAFNGDLEAVRSLLGQGADIEAEGHWEQTPLIEACDQGHVEVVKLLLAREPVRLHGLGRDLQSWSRGNGSNATATGGEIKTCTIESYAPLHQAAQGGYTSTVCDLLDHGAKIDASNPRTYSTALAEACWHGHLETVQVLLSRGALTETHDYGFSCTPLIRAAINGHTSIVILMLDHGNANIEGVDVDGRTALFHATLEGQARTVKALLDRDANTEIQDSMQFTPLCRAAESGRLAIVEKLLMAKANVHASNCDNWTPLSEASHHGHRKVAEALLVCGADTESPDYLDSIPLIRAAQAGRLSLVILLLDTGKANINATNHDGWTSLHEASFHGYPDVVKALLDRGASTGIRSKQHRTALDIAVRRKHKLVIDEFSTRGHFDTEFILV